MGTRVLKLKLSSMKKRSKTIFKTLDILNKAAFKTKAAPIEIVLPSGYNFPFLGHL